ncbi:uncharacterized protein KGF55_000091 [Candida pseudojiufengensis]|uniref:uncharacterized protein n=1 Tax=Candida pseudojiufengensis TaxID=497109 RepID=UPI002224B8FE|nr:uncharacterized protein KGF55_000091 [Candida pseudojiufengensis]KAI5967788.1 hypothetical protein KGF55_000091 [Candida pseudojiufengensis]
MAAKLSLFNNVYVSMRKINGWDNIKNTFSKFPWINVDRYADILIINSSLTTIKNDNHDDICLICQLPRLNCINNIKHLQLIQYQAMSYALDLTPDLLIKDFKYNPLIYDEEDFVLNYRSNIELFKSSNDMDGIDLNKFTGLVQNLTDKDIHPLSILAKHLDQEIIKLQRIEHISSLFESFEMFGELFGIDGI